MINVRYSLSVTLATRKLSDSCNLYHYAEKSKLLTIHEKTIDSSNGKCLKPLTDKSIQYINLFYELKKEINFDGFNPIILDLYGNCIKINKNSILKFLKTVATKDEFVNLSEYLKRSSFSLNLGRHVFATKSLELGFSREYEDEFMSHYKNAILGQGIFSNFDNSVYSASIERFMESIEKKYLPDYLYPVNLINDFYKYKKNNNTPIVDILTFKNYLEVTKKSIINYLGKDENEENRQINIEALEIIFNNLEEDRHYINNEICLDIQLWANLRNKNIIKKYFLLINILIKNLIKENFISKESSLCPKHNLFFKTNPVQSAYLNSNLRKYEDIIFLKYKFLEFFESESFLDIENKNLDIQINLFIYLKLFIIKEIDNYYLDSFIKNNFIYAGDKLILVIRKKNIDGFTPLDTVIFDLYTSNILKIILLNKGIDNCIFEKSINFYNKHLESFLKKNRQTKKSIRDAICLLYQFENTPLSLTLELRDNYPKICMQEIEKFFPNSVNKELLEIENKNLILYRSNKKKPDCNKRTISLTSDDELYKQFKEIIFNLPNNKRLVPEYLDKCYNFIDNNSKLAIIGSIFTFTRFIIEKIDSSISKKTIDNKTLLAYLQIYFDYCFDVILESTNKENIEEISINIDIKLKTNVNNQVFNKYKRKIKDYFDYIKKPIKFIRNSSFVFKRSVIFEDELDKIILTLRKTDGDNNKPEILKDRRTVFVIIAYFTGLRRNELRSRMLRDFYHIKNSNKFNIDVNAKGMKRINRYEKDTLNELINSNAKRAKHKLLELKNTNAKRAFEFEIPEKYLKIVIQYLDSLEKENIEFLFPSVNENGSFSKKKAIKLSDINSINSILLSITNRYCVVHSFRHGFISREIGKLLLKEDKSIEDIFNLIAIIGHASFYTSLRDYAHLDLIKLQLLYLKSRY